MISALAVCGRRHRSRRRVGDRRSAAEGARRRQDPRRNGESSSRRARRSIATTTSLLPATCSPRRAAARTARFTRLDQGRRHSAGPEVVATTGPNGDYTAPITLPANVAPTTSTPYTLTATVDEGDPQVGQGQAQGQGEGQAQSRARLRRADQRPGHRHCHEHRRLSTAHAAICTTTARAERAVRAFLGHMPGAVAAGLPLLRDRRRRRSRPDRSTPTSDTVAFMDINPATRGTRWSCPREHSADLLEIADRGPRPRPMLAAQRLAQRMKEVLERRRHQPDQRLRRRRLADRLPLPHPRRCPATRTIR